MKRLSLALAALGLSAGVLAGLPAATDPTVVSVPQLAGGFVIGGSGFYLQPANSNGDLDYVAFNTNIRNVDPGYNWGWGINVGYIFPNTGNDINISYFQLDTTSTSSVNVRGPLISPLNNNFNFPVMSILDVASTQVMSFISAKSIYDLNQIDLTAGQYLNVGCRLSLHPFAGLRWAQLTRKLNSTYIQLGSETTANNNFNQTNTFTEKSDFQGIGPIAGFDANYYIGFGLGVVGHFASSLLLGNVDASTTEEVQQSFSSSSASTNISQGITFNGNNANRVVPVLDGKLGLDYTYVFNNSANSDLTLEAGWMVSSYFNAVDRLQTNTDINAAANATLFPPLINSATITGRTTSDFSMQGPYISLVAHI